jgi:hypothetical protein
MYFMNENYTYNPDTSGTHPDSQPVNPKPAQTMAEAIAAFTTAVRVMPDGSFKYINQKPSDISPDDESLKAPKADKYGHVEGASAANLRRADQNYIKQQSRGKGRGPRF